MSFRSLKKKHAYDGSSFDSAIPLRTQKKLDECFESIETEFARIYQENQQLRAQLRQLERQLNVKNEGADAKDDVKDYSRDQIAELDGTWQSLPKNAQQFSKKVMSKYKEQTNKIVSSFRPPHISVNIKLLHRYSGHRDGIWDVTYCTGLKGRPLIGTASNDRSARIWQAEGAQCLVKYMGHTGSVNSIMFHPNLPLVLTSSGDRTAHIWSCDVPESDAIFPDECSHHSDDALSEEEAERDGPTLGTINIKTPQRTLTDHNNVVTSAEWMSGGTQMVTASWDRTSKVWDTESGTVIHTLSGHDQEILTAAAHPSQALIVTCSKDTTFRVWDFRTSIHSVNIYQGHSASVTCAVFPTHKDAIISGSDDCTVKVWDLRNMRTAICTIQGDASINKVAVSDEEHHTMAIAFDNRNVRLYDLQGTYLARLPRRSQPGHQRMVCSATWASDDKYGNLYTCGFDNRTICWKISLESDR